MFLTKDVTNKTTHNLGSKVFFMVIIEKYCAAGQTTDDTQYTMAHALFMQDS
jgi:hypothetical protein